MGEVNFKYWEVKINIYWPNEKTETISKLKMTRAKRFRFEKITNFRKIWFRIWLWWKKSSSRIVKARTKNPTKRRLNRRSGGETCKHLRISRRLLFRSWRCPHSGFYRNRWIWRRSSLKNLWKCLKIHLHAEEHERSNLLNWKRSWKSWGSIQFRSWYEIICSPVARVRWVIWNWMDLPKTFKSV